MDNNSNEVHDVNNYYNNNNDSNNIYSDRKMWQNVKKLTNKCRQIPPRIIKHNDNVMTSIRKITNIANKYFKYKILNIRSKFTTHNTIRPMDIQKYLTY